MSEEEKTTENERAEGIRTIENTKGRWLVARNLSVRPRHFPHPSRDAKDDEHLSLSSFQASIIDQDFLNSPSFTRHIRTEDNAADPEAYLEVYWTDTPPDDEFDLVHVIEDMMAREMPRPMALTAYYICAQEPIPEEYAGFLTLEPSPESVRRFGPTSLTAQWDMIRNHLPWLREVRSLEERWRGRDPVLALLDMRIDELEELRRTSGV
jgi:hypothetical protein